MLWVPGTWDRRGCPSTAPSEQQAGLGLHTPRPRTLLTSNLRVWAASSWLKRLGTQPGPIRGRA